MHPQHDKADLVPFDGAALGFRLSEASGSENAIVSKMLRKPLATVQIRLSFGCSRSHL